MEGAIVCSGLKIKIMYIYQVERDLLRANLSRFKDFLGGKVLDAGGGSGKRYKDLASKSLAYLTLDIDAGSKPDLVGSIEAIPVGGDSFDSVICTQVLGDLLYPERAIEEFRRVLKPRGKIIITEGFMNELHSEPLDYWRFTPFGLRGLLEDKNFKVIEAQIIGGFFSVVTQMLTRFFINQFDLYNSRIFGWLFSKFSFCIGKLSIALDRLFTCKANSKFGLGVIVLAELKK